MQHIRLLLLGIGCAFGGSLLIAGASLQMQLSGIVLGVIGAICIVIHLWRNRERQSQETPERV